MCSYFKNGCCTRGAKCSYAHSAAELYTRPNLAKTRFCIPFQHSGVCHMGAACNFAHYEEELRSIKPEKVLMGGAQVAVSQGASASLEDNLEFLEESFGSFSRQTTLGLPHDSWSAMDRQISTMSCPATLPVDPMKESRKGKSQTIKLVDCLANINPSTTSSEFLNNLGTKDQIYFGNKGHDSNVASTQRGRNFESLLGALPSGELPSEGDRIMHEPSGYTLTVQNTFIHLDDDSDKVETLRRSSSTSGLRHCGL